MLSLLAFHVSVIKYHDHTQLEDYSPSLREIRPGIQGRDLEMGTGAKMIRSAMAHSVAFFFF